MEHTIKINSKFDGRSHHGAFRQHLKHRWKWWLVARSFVCLALIGIGVFFSLHYYEKGEKLADFVTVAFLLMGSVGFIRPMIWQMFAERKLRKHPAYNTTIQYEFSHDYITMSGKAGDAKVPWKTFTELVPNQLGLLIYQNKKDYIWIPKYDFQGNEMNEVVALFNDAKKIYSGILSR